MGVIGLLQDFSGWTSAHGIPQIGGARNWTVRIIWSVIFLGAFYMFVTQFKTIVTSYLEFGVYVSTSIKFEERPFPALTLCNRNPYKKSVVEQNPPFNTMMQDFEEALTQGSVTSAADVYRFNNASDNLEVIAHAYDVMVYLANTWTDEEVDERSYPLEDIVLTCKFGTVDCDLERDFKKLRDPYYGTCWQFNNEDPSLYTISRPGEEFGLKLLLKNEQEEFLPMTEAAAFRITVHNQNQEPFPDAFGYVAAAGYVNSFAIKSSITKRLPEPYTSKCTATTAVPTWYYGDSLYSMEACFRSCYQKYIIDQCNCADPRFAKPDDATFCTIDQLPCVTGLKETKAAADGEATTTDDTGFDVIQDCDCPKLCDDTTYGVVATQAYWPSLVYKVDLCQNESMWMPWVNETDPVTGDWDIVQKDYTLDCLAMYHDLTTVVHVYMEQLTYQQYQENPSYGISDVVFNFGGQIGLWMGFSVITMVEWFGLSILIAMYCCAKSKGPKAITPETAHENDMNDIDEILEGASGSDDDDDEEDEDESDVDPYDDDGGDAVPPKPVIVD